MKITEDIRSRLEKVAQTEALADAAKTGLGEAIEMAKFESKMMAGAIVLGPALVGASAGLAASKMGDPTADDMKKIEGELTNAQVERATEQLDRQLKSKEDEERRRKSAAGRARSVRLD